MPYYTESKETKLREFKASEGKGTYKFENIGPHSFFNVMVKPL